ncbi:unnamed protein product, partial [marine sediment metagenome]
EYIKKSQSKIVVAGLDYAGKTSLINRLMHDHTYGDLINLEPTIGANIQEFESDNLNLIIWDLGGQKSKKIIAYMSHDNIPEELIDAAGFIPLRLIFSGNDELMDKGADYLPTSTCSFALSTIGLFSVKPNKYRFLDLIDYFIVSNHCVSDICSSEIICKYFDIPRIDFYVPYILSENGLKYYRIELIEFKKKLEEIRGSSISNEDIIKSIEKYNRFRRNISKIKYYDISGSDKLELYQKALLYGPKILELRDFNINNDGQIKIKNKKNVILTGCSIFLGDDLIEIIEEGGGNVIFLDTWVGDVYFSQTLEDNWLDQQKENDPFDILTEMFKKNTYTDHVVPNFLEYKIKKMLQFLLIIVHVRLLSNPS